MESLTYQELLKVLKLARKESLRDHMILLTTYSHAMRAQEVVDLRIGDLDGDTILIRRVKGSKQTRQPLVPHRGQPLLDEVRGMKRWLKARSSQDSLCAESVVFPSNKGPMSPTHVTRIYKRYALAAGLPKRLAHIHVLKHTSVSLMVDADMNLAKVSAWAGHASISSTMRYVHLSEDVSRTAIAVLQSMGRSY